MRTANKRYQQIALGGTFDHFHLGHQKFILHAATQAHALIIGVTSDKFTSRKLFPNSIQSLKTRIKAVLNFCRKNNLKHQVVILDDPYGPTIDRDNQLIDALCITLETLVGGEKINEIRLASKMKALPIFIAPLIKDELGQTLHAENIRAGEINRQGAVYLHHFKSDLRINAKQRVFFSNPLGEIVDQPQASQKNIVCVVGDFALHHFLQKNWPVDIGVFDSKSSRLPFNSKLIASLEIDLRINNPAGTISSELFEKIKNIKTKKRVNIFINGEEDLTSAAFILTLPLNSLLYYGQPKKGMVLLNITESLKEKIFRVLKN